MRGEEMNSPYILTKCPDTIVLRPGEFIDVYANGVKVEIRVKPDGTGELFSTEPARSFEYWYSVEGEKR